MRLNKTVNARQLACGRKSKTAVNCFLLGLALVLMSSCGDMNPKNVDVQLEKSAPVEKVTSYSQALIDLGLMSQIYDTGIMNVQSQDIADETGASVPTGGEIQKNITEIMKSTLNNIGGNVIFIEYNPSYIQNQMVSGYSSFDNKVVPDVVITGGITEFDRALEVRGANTNVDAEAEFTGAPKWFPSETAGASYGDTSKTAKSRITLDFNLKDFQTLAGIPRMTTTNSMEVHKGNREEEVGITLFGPTFGLKGSIRKTQGRHEAVRLLVQASMIQMIGKYLALPYWRLLGDDAQPDKVVLDSISATYYRMDRPGRINAVQQWLVLHGYDVVINNRLDSNTQAALRSFDPSFAGDEMGISEALFTKLYLTIPVNREALSRRTKMYDNLARQIQAPEAEEPKSTVKAQKKSAPPVEATPVAQQQATEVPVAQAVAEPTKAAAPVQEVAQAQQAVQAAPAPVVQRNAGAVEKAAAAAAPAAKPKKFGRQLSADEW